MSIIGSNILAGASGQVVGGGGYAISRSLRFNSSDSAFCARTPGTASNRKTWTWAGWIKRSGLNDYFNFYGNVDAASAQNGLLLRFLDTNAIDIYETSSSIIWRKTTTPVYRDPGAWFHLVVQYDTTNATAGDRVKLYVNDERVTAFSSSSDPSLNYDGYINTASAHSIGRPGAYNGGYFSGYLADIHFIDGQALDPTSFGEYDINGIWQPKAYTGSYGTNGFHLDFADNASTTTIGYDAAGSNDWTANNLSVTAGAGNDSLVDVPTNGAQTDTGAGGEVRGNYATFNPLVGRGVLSNGNLDFATASAGDNVRYTTIGVSSGKWYFETTLTSAVGDFTGVGLYGASTATSGAANTTPSRGYGSNGTKYSNGSSTSYGATFTNGDVIGCAFDIDAGKVWFSKNGTWQASGDPAAGTNAAYTDLAGVTWVPTIQGGNSMGAVAANFGQRPFAYAAPSGFKALNTANLPAPVVTKPSTVFDTKLYTGNGSTQTISGLGFSPDLVWIKNRAAADSHKLTDTVRGATEELESDTTAAEATNADGLTQFNADGFDLGDDDEYNTSAEAYAAWAWDAGSSTVTNTVGSISSQVRANASAGFSVVTHTGVGSTGTVGHGLGVAPSFYIVKARTTTAANSWRVYHSTLGATKQLFLEDTAAESTNSSAWNNTAPTSTVFSVGSLANESSGNYVAYCFAPVAGYSSGFSYTGNGSADGVFQYLGFRPRLIMLKRSDSTSNWTLLDTSREGYNVDNDPLYPNLSDAEGTTDLLDITSNGFKLRSTDASVNASAATYIGFAWAEAPFAYSRAR